MKILIGNMFDALPQTDLFLFTANSTVNAGKLVMGAGFALQVKERWPGIDLAIGKMIEDKKNFGLMISANWPTKKVGAFQTKTHWKLSSSKDVVKNSTAMLKKWAAETHPESRVDLNFPAIGLGGMPYNDVLEIVSELPQNVNLWKLK
jgi:hypothetical protein